MFQSYKSVNEVYSLYRRNRPLSAVRCYNSEFYIAVDTGNKKDMKGIAISFECSFHVSTLSMHFHKMKMDLSLTKFDLVSINESEINCYLLLLPEVNINGFHNIECISFFYVIDSNWNELDDEMNMKKPMSPGCKY